MSSPRTRSMGGLSPCRQARRHYPDTPLRELAFGAGRSQRPGLRAGGEHPDARYLSTNTTLGSTGYRPNFDP